MSSCTAPGSLYKKSYPANGLICSAGPAVHCLHVPHSLLVVRSLSPIETTSNL